MWGLHGDWASRRPGMVAGFAELAPDLLTLQEAVVEADYDQPADVLDEGYQLVHQKSREPDGSGVTSATRWPLGETFEVDLNVTDRTADFACTSLVTEILVAEPVGRVWLVNNIPNWQLDYEHERQLQALVTARTVEKLLVERPGHVIVAGDFDAPPDASSLRFWTGRQALEGVSVCYRDAWESAHPGEAGHTFAPDNPHSADWDWPFRRIDYILVRCGRHGGPTLRVASCQRTFDQPHNTVSDHYGLVADLELPNRD